MSRLTDLIDQRITEAMQRRFEREWTCPRCTGLLVIRSERSKWCPLCGFIEGVAGPPRPPARPQGILSEDSDDEDLDDEPPPRPPLNARTRLWPPDMPPGVKPDTEAMAALYEAGKWVSGWVVTYEQLRELHTVTGMAMDWFEAIEAAKAGTLRMWGRSVTLL